MAKANGSDPDLQAEFDLAQTEEAPAADQTPAEPSPSPQEDRPRVIELVNSHEGSWKVLDTGDRVPLSDEEWRTELARHFKHAMGGDD